MSERQKKKFAQREANRLKRRMIEKVLSSSKTSNVAFNLNLLVDGWLELESDPGTFSLLIEDFGCLGAQVDEIYDLEQKLEGPVLGFIFLFKWLNNNQHNDRIRNQKPASTLTNSIDKEQQQQQSEKRQPEWSYLKDENIISEIFFAKQMISNSCATHALISILLNCDYGELNLGPTLTRLKEYTKIMSPENKGYAIGNLPELAKAHNSHASYSSLYNRNKPLSHSATGMSYMISGNQRTNLQQQNNHEAYHFVSFVPINNRLYELDGLKNYPIDHGPFGPKEDWTEKFRCVIKERLLANKTGDSSTLSNDIRYNLMAVVPDKRVYLRAELKKLKHHHKIVQDSIKRLTTVVTPSSVDDDIPNPPYSPLSTGTLTASETGSTCNSPKNVEAGFFSDEDDKIDKYFFVKFEKQTEAPIPKEENLEPALSQRLLDEIAKVEGQLKEEIDKRRKYKIDNARKTHNYEPFIVTFLSMLAKQGLLADLIEKDIAPEKIITPKPKEKYVKTGRPVGRPRKNPLVTPPVTTATTTTTTPATANPKEPETNPTPKPKYKYVSTGRPVGRPRKNPLVPPPVKTTNTK